MMFAGLRNGNSYAAFNIKSILTCCMQRQLLGPQESKKNKKQYCRVISEKYCTTPKGDYKLRPQSPYWLRTQSTGPNGSMNSAW